MQDRDHRPRLRRPAARRSLRRSGRRRRRPRRRRRQGRGARTPAAATSRTSRDAVLAPLAERLQPTLELRRAGRLRGGDRLRADAADRLARARPHLPASTPPTALAAILRARPAGRARVDHLPGHDPRAPAPILEELRAERRHRLPPRLLAGADRPRPHRLHGAHHAEARRRGHRGLGRARRASSTGRSATRSSSSPPPRRRSWRSCWRTSSARSTSPSSTSSRSSATGSGSTSGR